MFEYIIGKPTIIEDDRIVIEKNGIGYIIFMSERSLIETREKISQKKEEDIKIYTYMQVREDDISLFGFANYEEKKMFTKLISVSKIGPKTAIAILSKADPIEFAMAIINNDINHIATYPGIGKKTAARIVLELQDKLIKEDINFEKVIKDDNKIGDDIIMEAKVALKVLGFMTRDIDKVINKAAVGSKNAQDIIKNALKLLSK